MSARRAAPPLFLLLLLGAPAVRAQETQTLFVPVVVSSSGRSGSFFTSEMVETNRGNRDATVSYVYTDATGVFASGSASNPQPLPAGRQRVIADVVAYLRNLGVPIPAGLNAFGTLRVTFANLHAASDAAITVRTTTPVPADHPVGRAGLAYSALPPLGLLRAGTAGYLCGLKQNAVDRTNIAFQNAGGPDDGDVTLRVSVIPTLTLQGPDQFVTLSPGGFKQYALTDLASSATEAFVRVSVESGTAPFYAYAVVNDQANSDGSFIAPVKSGTGAGVPAVVMPTIVETPVYSTEIVLANLGAAVLSGVLTLTSTAVTTPTHAVSIPVALSAFEQRTYPAFVQFLRSAIPVGVPPAGATITGTLSFRPDAGDASAVFLGGRILNAGGGGRYGVFTSALPDGVGADAPGTWVYGLRQDAENRTNLALVNLGNADAAPLTLHVAVYDGSTGGLAGATDQVVPALGFVQLNAVLSQIAPTSAQGYARITRTAGSSRFLAYAVVNDGAQPGQRSGDGAVIAMDSLDVSRYAGTWHNVSFGTTGSAGATLAFERATRLLAVTFDLGGNVFGEGPAGPQTLFGSQGPSGATLSGTTSVFGPVSAAITPLGAISGSAPTIPNPNIASMTFDGTFVPGVSINLNYNLARLPSGVAYGTVTMAPAP